jgi:hypothetical protein
MAYSKTETRRSRSLLLAGFVVAIAVLIGIFVHQSQESASLSVSSGELGEADGVVPDGVTVFDDDVPAVANLDPGLLKALREAATDAGVKFYVNSGWRSPAYQSELLDEAIKKYGSREEAARWVATPDTSPHVSGQAIDVGHAKATAWLSKHGAKYGLCQIYDNEPWHYELRPKALANGCPRRYADPTHDPRTQQ